MPAKRLLLGPEDGPDRRTEDVQGHIGDQEDEDRAVQDGTDAGEADVH